jgi:hypothetical protein
MLSGVLSPANRPWWLAVLRLTGLLVALGLATSRLGLIAHELVGHGGFAVASGGEVTEVRLFWFAGGWIRYDLHDPTAAALLAISLGGIVVETVIGTGLWVVLARRDSLAARLARAIGAALVIHAGWYFATGSWHGYGDGVLVHRLLGDWRYPVAIAVGLGACGVANVAARLVLGALAATVPGGRGARVAGLAIAMAIAAVLQIGLALGEVRVRGDSTYGAIMKPERERVIARELLEWQREQARLGAQLTEADREARARELAGRHRELPFAPVLAVLLVAAVVLGARRPRGPASGTLTRRFVWVVGALAVGSITAVIALDAAFL